jgi:rubrerythrin
MTEAVDRLDTLMRQLVETDQVGRQMEPVAIAAELGKIRQLMIAAPTVLPRPGGLKHWRCETCGTISHDERAPAACPQCQGRSFFPADIIQPNVESGAG